MSQVTPVTPLPEKALNAVGEEGVIPTDKKADEHRDEVDDDLLQTVQQLSYMFTNHAQPLTLTATSGRPAVNIIPQQGSSKPLSAADSTAMSRESANMKFNAAENIGSQSKYSVITTPAPRTKAQVLTESVLTKVSEHKIAQPADKLASSQVSGKRENHSNTLPENNHDHHVSMNNVKAEPKPTNMNPMPFDMGNKNVPRHHTGAEDKKTNTHPTHNVVVKDVLPPSIKSTSASTEKKLNTHAEVIIKKMTSQSQRVEPQGSEIKYQFSRWGEQHYVNIAKSSSVAQPLAIQPSDTMVQQRLAVHMMQPGTPEVMQRETEHDREQQHSGKREKQQHDEDEAC